MKKKFFIKSSMGLLLSGWFLLTSFGGGKSVATRFTGPTGDTTSFVPYSAGGWSILSSYLNQDTPDSVEFELILEAPTGKIRGSVQQLIGTISNNLFIPKRNQVVSYTLLPGNKWNMIITKKGQCYLVQEMGVGIKSSVLPGNPDVIPIKVRYKND